MLSEMTKTPLSIDKYVVYKWTLHFRIVLRHAARRRRLIYEPCTRPTRDGEDIDILFPSVSICFRSWNVARKIILHLKLKLEHSC